LSALADCSILIRDDDKLAVNIVGNCRPLADRHVGLHQVLDSQSGTRSYMKSRRDKESEQLISEKEARQQLKQPSIVVHAGAHQSMRMRASAPNSSPWSMQNIFYDTNTVNQNVKYLKEKFADEQRDHFAAPGSAFCDSKQVTPLQGLMKEMKIFTLSSDGYSVQESTSVVPVTEDDDIGV